MPPRRATGEDENPPDIATLLAQQLQNLVPEIVNHVTTNVNANANNGNGNGGKDGNGRNGNNGCTYKSVMSCNPKEYNGKGGAVVRYVVSLLVNKALTWWNTQVQPRGREAANAISWNDFKALLVEEFCPSNEMERLENEFWNHKMIRANHAGYTDRFHELAKLVPYLVTPKSARIKRYMAGLAPEIRGMLKATQPATIQSANTDVDLEGMLRRQKEVLNLWWRLHQERGMLVRNPGVLNAVHIVMRRLIIGYETNCQRPDHFARDCRSPAIPTAPVNAVDASPNQRACYKCGEPNHLRTVYPKLNQESGQSGNQLALGWHRNDRGGRDQVRGSTWKRKKKKKIVYLNKSIYCFLYTQSFSIFNPL
ncbi:reverse transcriptase domain-containing protein [Tanacetum coccineum]